MTDKKSYRVLSAAQLKYLAFISMFIDHVNNGLITPLLDGRGSLLVVSNIFSILGRIAFPIFIFFIVEGYFKTKNRLKYLIRLLIFGIISEVPFDMFTSKVYYNPNWNNMIFTLALCLVTVWLIDYLKGKITNKIIWYLLSFVIVIGMSFLAMALSLDYDYHAIVLAYIFYIFYDRLILGAVLGYLSIIKEVYSFLGFGLVTLYNGKEGNQYKWLNYAFYPAHLLVLGLLRFYFNL